METRLDLPATLPRQRLEFTYDHQGRRVRKQTFDWNATSENFTPKADLYFIYHGWKLLAEGRIQSSEFIIQTSHLWGHDLTGTFEGAGTVGGLLATTQYLNPSTSNTYFIAYDGNGNVAAAVNAATGDTEARFHYGPFGETLTATGPAAEKITHRFSTKYTDPETGLLYYGFRYLNLDTGRWLNRDPIEEEGGLNLYEFARNDGVNQWDYLGMQITDEELWAQEERRNRLNQAARDNALAQLTKAQTGRFGGLIAQSSNWPQFIRGLEDSTKRIKIRHLSRFSRADALYNRLTKTASFRSDASMEAVIHEMVHASVHLRGIQASIREDEGMAYASEEVAAFINRTQGFYDVLENSRLDGEPYRELVRRSWSAIWINNQESEWRSVYWPRSQQRLANSDIELLRRNFNVDYSCQKVANIFNNLPQMRRNCIFVHCGQNNMSFMRFHFVSPGFPVPESIK